MTQLMPSQWQEVVCPSSARRHNFCLLLYVLVNMIFANRRIFIYLVIALLLLLFLSYSSDVSLYRGQRPSTGDQFVPKPTETPITTSSSSNEEEEPFFWRTVPVRHPVTSMRSLPTDQPLVLPKVQAEFPSESPERRQRRQQRQKAVKDAFTRCWSSYKSLAWKMDELTPISGSSRNGFGGWGATLIDSLDTLWIMGMRDKFQDAVAAVLDIDFSTTSLSQINVFETNIRYLGGLLAAYDLSHDQRLLTKATEVGDLLYAAFDTPNRMPITRWDLHKAARQEEQEADEWVLVAEVGSLTLEFTRLSQITREPKWFDAVQRIMEIFDEQQNRTKLPGMWPVAVNTRKADFTQDTTYTLGAMADSLYEYLPKTYALLGGLEPMYQRMYELAMRTAIEHNLFRPIVPDSRDILIPGIARVTWDGNGQRQTVLEPEGQHLVCFAGGMFALGGKLFGLSSHVEIAQKLVDGCIWTYQAMPLGIMPETFHMAPCTSLVDCPWDEKTWKQQVLLRANVENMEDIAAAAQTLIEGHRLPPGFTAIGDARYILRPEAIESIFILYRITGREDLLDAAWQMFEAIQTQTATILANAALSDVTVTDEHASQSDSMESFWMGETLKYFISSLVSRT
jgi:mannosyl-oligosaccharide alpha-1,2-mannosidase